MAEGQGFQAPATGPQHMPGHPGTLPGQSRVLELLSSPAAAAQTRLPGTEKNLSFFLSFFIFFSFIFISWRLITLQKPSFFVSKSGVWMAQDRWGLGCGEKRSIWIMGL